jgi:hypothetical protein
MEINFLWRLVGHDDRAGGGEHAAHTMADRDPGVGDLGGGGAAHLARALLQGVHAVLAGMHVGEAAAIGVERELAAGGGVALGDEGAGLAARHKAQIFEAADRQMREGVVDHHMVDVVVRDAGLGKGRGSGDAEGARGGVCSSPPRKSGGPGQLLELGVLDSRFRGNDG